MSRKSNTSSEHAQSSKEFNYSGSFGLPPPSTHKQQQAQSNMIEELKYYEQTLDIQKRQQLLRRVLPGFDKISPYKQPQRQPPAIQSLSYGGAEELNDVQSDAGTVVEKQVTGYSCQ